MMENDTNNLNSSLILGLSRLVNVVGKAIESFNAFFSTIPRRRSARMRKKHKGRWKTRGGRDQDQWRKGYPRVKQSRQALIAAKNARSNIRQWCRLEDLLRSSGTWALRFVPNGCDGLGETIKLIGCPGRDDFVKGGE